MRGNNVFFYGDVELGAGSSIQDNVIVGSEEDGSVKIGANALIRSGTVIYSGAVIGKNFQSGHNVLIRENTVIGDDVLVGTNSVIDGDCRIGTAVRIQTNVYITRNTVVEDDVFFGPFAVTLNDKYMVRGAELRGPVIRKGARIGANSSILPGIMVGANAVVGAGAVVTKVVEAGVVVAGNPARPIR